MRFHKIVALSALPSLLVVFASIISFPVHAVDGNEFLRNCAQQRAGFQSGYCMGYVVGIADGASAQFEVEKANAALPWGVFALNPIFCRPNGVTNGQLQDIAVQFLQRNPQRRHEDAMLLVLNAFTEAFPCSVNSEAWRAR